MIKGIEILNKTEIMTTPSWLVLAIIIGAITILVVGALISALAFDCSDLSMFITGVLVFVYAINMLLIFSDTVPTGGYKYEAVIEESVPISDVYEKYDVIEQKGKIWILEDKEISE